MQQPDVESELIIVWAVVEVALSRAMQRGDDAFTIERLNRQCETYRAAWETLQQHKAA